MPHRRLILDAYIAAVLLTILGLTSAFFIQTLVDSVLVLGRKPALNWLGLGMLLVTLARAGFFGLRSHLVVAHLSHRIEAEAMPGLHRHLPGLPFTLLSITITCSAMLWLNWELTLRSLQLIPALAGIVWIVNKHSAKQTAYVFSSAAAHFTTGASSLGLLWFGGQEVLDGQLTLGQLLALHTMLVTILPAMEQFVLINFSDKARVAFRLRTCDQ
jgi:ABC-type bacteriocin/lantibiotic exporter with double-glycine peptidase domain